MLARASQMHLLPHHDPAADYEISGETLNALIQAVNEWNAFNTVEVITGTSAIAVSESRLEKSEGGTVLRIFVPPCA